jgi:two-component system, OmpR family, phosphate regulon sensor histidine kinase PhoR
VTSPAPPVDVGHLLRRAFAALIAIIVLSGVAGVVTIVPLANEINRQLSGVLRIRAANGQVRSPLGDAQLALDGYLATGQAADLQAYHTAVQRYPDAIAALRRTTVGTDEAAQVEELNQRVTAWQAAADRLAATPPGTTPSPADVDQVHELIQAALSSSLAIDTTLTTRAATLHQSLGRLTVLLVIALAGLTVTGIAVATMIGIATTRRITTPLGKVVGALDELSAGRIEARVSVPGAPKEIAAVAAAVNATGVQACRERELGFASRRLSTAVRDPLSAEQATATAVRGLGGLFAADHVLVRPFAGQDVIPEPVTWSAPSAPGDLGPLAQTPVDWLPPDTDEPFVAAGPTDGGGPPPMPERAALDSAQAGSVMTLAVGEKNECLGHVTIIRTPGHADWTMFEVQVAEIQAADLRQALMRAKMFEREKRVVAQLREVDKAKTDFLSTVSHELRTPLTSICGYLELLVDEDAGPLNSQQTQMLQVIDRNAARLRGLIEDLLIMSRMESGRLPHGKELLDAAELITATESTFSPQASTAGVTLAFDVQGPLPVRGDAEQLDRVLMNLLSNAVKFTPRGGRVTVNATSESGHVVIAVRDTGIGIPADDVPKLFGRFFRAHNATDRAIPGTGLGLSIVAAIVKSHGGTIAVDSSEGAGTTFTIHLPVAEAA